MTTGDNLLLSIHERSLPVVFPSVFPTRENLGDTEYLYTPIK
jgi:hypothetical protein